MKVNQIVTVVDIANRYKNRIKMCQNVLNWELMQSGETNKAKWLRQEIEEQEEALGKFLDEEV